MLTKTSLSVFIIFLGPLGYIVMSDSEKKNYLKKEEEDLPLFLVAKREKTYTKYFSHQRVLVRNGIPNRGLFAEAESTIRPLPLVRLIKSAVAPLLLQWIQCSLANENKEVMQTSLNSYPILFGLFERDCAFA